MLLNRTSTLAVISAFLSPVADILAPMTEAPAAAPEAASPFDETGSKLLLREALPEATAEAPVPAAELEIVSAVTVAVS